MFFLVVVFLQSTGTLGFDYHDPHCGGKQVIVHLFNWKWTDIALECERYLGPKGFCAVQISPPNEHLVEQPKRPWSERYAPVSYKLTSRSGTEAELKDMVARCKVAGVRIYADAVINHMCGVGFSGVGSAGSHFDAEKRDFPGVPYSVTDFNMGSRCPNADDQIHNYDNLDEVRNCSLGGLTDLNQRVEWVRQKIADYLNSLIDIGVAGFRIDAAKHIWPEDLSNIFSRLHSVDGGTPFVYNEVVPQGAVKLEEYFPLGYVTEFRYGDSVRAAVNNFNELRGVVHSGMLTTENALVFVDNHDTQRTGQLNFKSPAEYKRAQAFTQAFNYGFTSVMSSYQFTEQSDPPPHDGDVIKDVIINADGSCGNGWVCEHRWKPIGNMARFRNDVVNTGLLNWNVQGDIISFSRGNVGFFAMGKTTFNINVNTGLPQGDYCDLISDCAMKIQVDGSGRAQVRPHDAGEPFVAFTTTSKNGGDRSAPTLIFKRTVILIEDKSGAGADLFIRGGIGHSHRPDCTTDAVTSSCSIPIRHRTPGTSSYYNKVNTWSKGDNFLDWYGPEAAQEEFQTTKADGTPAYRSTNIPGQPGYFSLNTYGPNYWVIDVDMDCSRTDGDYFEFKAIANGVWEEDVSPSGRCSGDSPGNLPYPSVNHFAKCGYLNVFHLNSRECQARSLP
ncbi:unnamed protein product [Candidula unifasciata]|uniref:Alpha-amylase n=1 Tax=Candidula unifasciata TaxID=100452 RepID=A0A8S3Z4L4_9EUPU|nr:unnamed protein product [Candidula unifasciata]